MKPEIAEVADVRHLDVSPRSFRTPVAGLLLFVPLLDRIDLHSVVTAARLPGTIMIPAAQAVRTLLALKLVGKERKSHVMDLSTRRHRLFAGLNVVPKRSYLAAYSSSVDDRAIERLMAAWFNETPAPASSTALRSISISTPCRPTRRRTAGKTLRFRRSRSNKAC